ncbi:MAG: transposase [Bacteroidales bacterium]|nr:transposase [Bacteroidales bacterium]
MSRKYKFRDQNAIYFVSFAIIYWIDVFTRPVYRHLLVDSINYCIHNKGLIVYAWCIMTNHVHMIIGTDDKKLQDIMRDLKGYTSRKLIKTIEENFQESRREWMLKMMKKAGQMNGNNEKYQFWQQHNHPIVLNNTDIFEQKLNYIHNNPVEEEIVENPEDYLYSSAKDYADEKGLVLVTLPW